MDIDIAILLRTVERLIAVSIGGLAIVLGYRLFLRVPDRREGEGQFKLWDVSIVLSRIGPGVFFALFGAAVVALSFYKGVAVETSRETVPDDATRAESAPAANIERFSGLGSAPPAIDADRRTDARALLRRDIAFLNTLDRQLRADLSEQDRTQVALAVPRIKFALMQAVWPEAEPGWGTPERFAAWLDAGVPEPVPDEIAAAAAYFRYGVPGARP